MVGLHIYNNRDGIEQSVDHTATLQLETWHEKKEYFNNGIFSVSGSFYKGYPINQFIDDNLIIIYEGIIYNRTNDEVFSFCKSIANSSSDVTLIKNQVGDFVESSDGDFILFVYNKLIGNYIIFNDLTGRLPFYYYFDLKRFIAGRSIPFIVHNVPQIAIDKNALTEFIMIEFLIGKNTFFKDVQRLSPAEIIFIIPTNEGLEIITQRTREDCFVTDNSCKNKEEAIEILNQEFTKAARNRIEELTSQGYNLFNTLSGGFDSRAVFGTMNNVTQDFTNVTYEYVQDESVIAKQLLERTDSKSRFVKLSFNNKVNLLDSSLLFRTGNGVNIYTTSVCYNDALFMKREILKNKDCLFGGFGGEYIRHPYYSFPISPYTYLCYSYPEVPVQALLPVFNVTSSGFKKFIMSTLKQYKEKSDESVYKHLYEEYYRNYVVGAGEDRTRMFVWTVQPLMATSFIQIIRKRIPLKWSNFQFFTDFMSKIDSRLLDIPVFGKTVDLHNKNSIKKLTPSNQKLIRSVVLTLVKKYGWRFFRNRMRDKTNTIGFDTFDLFFQRLDFYKDYFNYTFIKREYNSWPFSVKNRLLSVAMYLAELEKHYKDKLGT
jgi:asparagine synthase (glutamine-hydrolysing)